MSTAPANADSATPPPTSGGAVTSLVAALNAKQKELVDKKIVQYADEYSIEFNPPWLGDSTLRKPGKTADLARTPMAASQSGLNDPARVSVSPDLYSRTFDGGQSIAFIINRIMMESSYVYDQQSVIIDTKGNPQPNGKAAQTFAWYNILCLTTPTDKWDSLRRDWAYKIKYVIVPYETPVLSEYFPNGQFRGAHKNYNYWFTGQNTDVLYYEVTNNNAYYNVINTPTAGTKFKNLVNSLNIVRANYAARNRESDQGAAERVNDVAANAADWLYNAVDYSEIRLRIVGDPAWINAENYSAPSDVGFESFRSDGSINFSTGAAYFTINYNLANDYNIDTGLMNIIGSSTVQNVNGSNPTGPALSFNYTAVECRSSFRQGRFEQELVGRLRLGEASDQLIQDRTRVNTESRVANGRTPPVAADDGSFDRVEAARLGVRALNLLEIPQGIQGDVVNIPNGSGTVRIGPVTLPVVVPALNPANRPLLNVGPRSLVPGVNNPPVPSDQTPNPNGGQNMQRDP